MPGRRAEADDFRRFLDDGDDATDASINTAIVDVMVRSHGCRQPTGHEADLR